VIPPPACVGSSTPDAPWYVIPSDHKWFRNLAISQIIHDKMEALRIRVPKPTVDIADIRKNITRRKGTMNSAPARRS
jgi:hypothetical protein